MNPGRWARLEQLFDAASVLDAPDRANYIARETDGDPEMRADLESLLAHDGQARGAGQIIGDFRSAAEPYWIGKRIGAYCIVREIGRGGMGIVFEARRTGDFQQTVALKLCGQGAFSPAFRERFERERQILAALNHPYIARLLDGGATPEGVPYFVMELVEGQPLNRFEGDKRKLFLKICEAASYAHGHLVVHRDLKPSNILVDSNGTPKLLDFGIATLTGDTGGVTQTALGPVTPDYAAPEQLLGGLITVRTDVYQLGLLLYELSTGRRGQQTDSSSLGALERSICETELPNAGLDADLSTILSTATAKDPAARYSSVAALAADFTNYLENRPIAARPASAASRLRKFIARNRLATLAVVAVAAAILAGTVSTLYQARRAERRFNQVRGIARTLMFDVQDSVRPLAASAGAQKIVVKSALDYLNALSAEAGADRALRTEIAEGYARISEIESSFLEPSLDQRETGAASAGKAQAMFEQLHQEDPAGAQVAIGLAGVYLSGAEGAVRSGRFSEGQAKIESAIDILRKTAQSNPGNRDVKRKLAQAYARFNRDIGSRSKPTLEYALAPIAVLEEIVQSDAAAEPELAQAYSAAGAVYFNLGQAAPAAEQFRKAIAIHERRLAAEPGNVSTRKSLMLVYASLGDAHWGFKQSLGDRPGALIWFSRMSAEARRLLDANPASPVSRFDYAMSRMRHGAALAPRDPEAKRMLAEATGIVEAHAAADPQNTGARRQLMDLYLRLAARHQELGEFQPALAAWRKSAAIGEAMRAEPANLGARTWLIRTYLALGDELNKRGNKAEARALAPILESLADEIEKLDNKNTVVIDLYNRARQWASATRK
ncbi:MAG: hypothetical protein FJW30_03170 [Acidobacteria bacterium]|nr:hypothetical protein [Acidobacteriota bacterium]